MQPKQYLMTLRLFTAILILSVFFSCKKSEDTGFEPTAPFLMKKQVFAVPGTDEDPVSSVATPAGVKIAGNNGNSGSTNFHSTTLTTTGDFAADTWKAITQTSGKAYNKCNRIEKLNDGNFVMLGTAGNSPADREAYAVVVDASGNYVKHYNTDNPGASEFNSAVILSDGSMIIAGSSSGFPDVNGEITGEMDFYLVKLDASLTMAWQKNYGTVWSDGAVKIVPFDNNQVYYVLGYTDTDIDNLRQLLLLRINNVGDSIWGKMYGTENDDEPRDIIRTEDDNHVILSSVSGDNKYLQFYKIEPTINGRDQWLGTGKWDTGKDIDAYQLITHPTPVWVGGAVLAVGYGYALGRDDEDMMVLKFNLSFDNETAMYTIGEAEFNERGKTAVEVSDGVMIIGYKTDRVGNTNKDLFAAKIRK